MFVLRLGFRGLGKFLKGNNRDWDLDFQFYCHLDFKAKLERLKRFAKETTENRLLSFRFRFHIRLEKLGRVTKGDNRNKIPFTPLWLSFRGIVFSFGNLISNNFYYCSLISI